MKDHVNRHSAGDYQRYAPNVSRKNAEAGLLLECYASDGTRVHARGFRPQPMHLHPSAASRATSASNRCLWKAIIRRVVLSLVGVCTVLAQPLSRADAVADWNRIALDTMVQSDQRPEYRLNTMATLNVAMFEALNFVRGRYPPHFVVGLPEMHGVSMDAVAAAAAHYILVSSYPNQEAALDVALRASLDALPADHARASGVITGASIGAVIRAVTSSEEGDGELSRLGSTSVPADWRQDKTATRLKPWLLETTDQFHRTAPISPHGALLTRDDRDASTPASRARWSGERKVAQVVRFWSLANPLGWNPIVTELIAVRALALDESARIHALASIVAAEAYFMAVDIPDRCAPCIAAASVAHILASEVGASASESEAFDTDRDIGRAIARSALRQYYRPLGQP